MEASDQPSWITTPKNSAEYYFGMSAELVRNQDISLAIQTSKRQAIEDLASSVRVKVKSQLTVSEALNSSGQSRQDIESLSTLTVDNTLEEVEVDDIWLDQENCQLWTLVKVSKQSVKTQKERSFSLTLLSKLQKLLDQSDDPNTQFLVRLEKVKLARKLFERISFKLLTSASSDIEQSKLNSVEAKFDINTPKFKTAKILLNELNSVSNQFANHSEPATRSKLALEAKALSHQILEIAPLNLQLGISEQALALVADIDLSQNNSCGAKTRWKNILKYSRNNKYLQLAKQNSSSLSCSKKELKKAAIRAVFEGQKVKLWCSTVVNNEHTYWEKACDALRETITLYGAIVSSSKPVSDVANTATNKVQAKSKHIDITLLASGTFESRNNPKNPNGTDYRFNGKVNQQITNTNHIIMKDSFSGLTGWNPVSENFALDLLALNLSKRFKSKLSYALSN